MPMAPPCRDTITTHHVTSCGAAPQSRGRRALPLGLLFQNGSQTVWWCLQVWIWGRAEHSLDDKGIGWCSWHQSPPPGYSWKHGSALSHASHQSVFSTEPQMERSVFKLGCQWFFTLWHQIAGRLQSFWWTACSSPQTSGEEGWTEVRTQESKSEPSLCWQTGSVTCRVSVCRIRSPVLVPTLGCCHHSLWGTRPAPHTSWCYSHTRPSFLLQTHTQEMCISMFPWGKQMAWESFILNSINRSKWDVKVKRWCSLFPLIWPPSRCIISSHVISLVAIGPSHQASRLQAAHMYPTAHWSPPVCVAAGAHRVYSFHRAPQRERERARAAPEGESGCSQTDRCKGSANITLIEVDGSHRGLERLRMKLRDRWLAVNLWGGSLRMLSMFGHMKIQRRRRLILTFQRAYDFSEMTVTSVLRQ